MSNQDYYVTFLRHGESVGNAENRFQGQADFALTEKGRAQAEVLADRWQAEGVAFDLCVSSPLARARETAEIIAGRLNIPLEFDPDWQEMNNGRLAGLTDEEAGALDRPQFFTPYTPYGETGESRWELYLRAGRGIQSLLNRPAGRYLVVSHGAILNMAMYTILSIAPQAQSHGPRFFFRNTTFANFVYNPDSHNWRMLGFERAHWPPNGRK
jgi:broad specificity phosphatase PhoE